MGLSFKSLLPHNRSKKVHETFFGKKKEDPRIAAAQRMAQVYADYETPSEAERIYELVELSQVGELTPEQEQELTQAATEYENISVDPQFKESQLGIMHALEDRAGKSMSAQEQEELGQIQDAQAQQSSDARQQAVQAMASRGLGGGGQELAAQLGGNAQAADEARSRFSSLLGSAADRRASNVMEAGGIASSMRDQDYSEAAKKASAQDLINRFNVGERAGVQQRNVASSNQAQAANLAEKQRIADINVDKKTDASRMARDARLGYEKDELERRLGVAGKDLQTSGADWDKNEANKKANKIGGVVSTAGSLIKAFK